MLSHHGLPKDLANLGVFIILVNFVHADTHSHTQMLLDRYSVVENVVLLA